MDDIKRRRIAGQVKRFAGDLPKDRALHWGKSFRRKA